MNDILQQIMNMIENTRTVPSISSFSMIGFTVLLIFGVINCILGYRLLRFWMMLGGFLVGGGLALVVVHTMGIQEKSTMLMTALVLQEKKNRSDTENFSGYGSSILIILLIFSLLFYKDLQFRFYALLYGTDINS